MNNKTLKKQLRALCDSIDLALINPDEYQVYDLDLVICPDTTAERLVDWFLQAVGSTGRQDKAIFVLSYENLKILQDLCDDHGTYLCALGIGLYRTIIGRPYMLKAKI